MRLLTLGFCILLSASASASAMEADRQNVFKADLSNSDLEQAVTAFENVCLPFVWHTTEMDRMHDNQHNKVLIQSQGYELQDTKTFSRRVIIEPASVEWKPTIQVINAGDFINFNTKTGRQFTVFNGVNQQAVESTHIIPTGEIGMVPQIPARYKTITTQTQAYVPQDNARLTAFLGWNYESQKHPAKSCEIHIKSPSMTEADFTEHLLEKDPDWAVKGEGFSQCASQADDTFLFTVEYSEDALSIRMKRNDFYEDDPCKTQIKSVATAFGK